MTEMEERVALAISGSDDPRTVLGIHRTRARAAIKAMREPTEQMIAACDINIPTEGMITDVWDAMIGAALGEER